MRLCDVTSFCEAFLSLTIVGFNVRRFLRFLYCGFDTNWLAKTAPVNQYVADAVADSLSLSSAFVT